MKKVTYILVLALLLTAIIGCSANQTVISNSTEIYYDEEGNAYKYKLVLTGKMPNAVNEGTITILTDDNTLTYEKVMSSLYSSYSRAHEGIHFKLVTD